MGSYPRGGRRPSPAAGGAGLPPVIQALSQPEFYPHGPGEVQLVQTHISYVFLAGPLVYKVKKPVDFGFLNYSTLRRRAFWCRREVSLNRRLAPDLYRGVAKIYGRRGEYSLRPPGKVVEYAVVMKRLPEKRIFASLMSRGRATLAQARKIARRVAAFHSFSPIANPRNSRLSVLRRNIEENFRQTGPYIGRTVKADDYLRVRDYSLSFLEKRAGLLRRRVREGRFRDGHGDLHAEHICLTGGIVIFDCLEFNPRLRQCDVAAEVAFLYMDLLYHRHPHLARAFAEEYLRVTGDWEIRLLLPFYACYRAVVREKVESLRFSDPHVSASRKKEARRRAAAYFSLARDLALKDGRPRLFTVGGLPGTGKSSLASLWAERLGALYINSDVVRRELAGRGKTPPGTAPFRGGIYTPEWTKKTYGEMAQRAEESLRAGRSVVLDATFARRSHRRSAAGAARRAGARLTSVECRCTGKTVMERLRRRERRGGSLSDADWDIYLAMKKEYAAPRRETVRVDTGRSTMEEALEKIAAAACPL